MAQFLIIYTCGNGTKKKLNCKINASNTQVERPVSDSWGPADHLGKMFNLNQTWMTLVR